MLDKINIVNSAGYLQCHNVVCLSFSIRFRIKCIYSVVYFMPPVVEWWWKKISPYIRIIFYTNEWNVEKSFAYCSTSWLNGNLDLGMRRKRKTLEVTKQYQMNTLQWRYSIVIRIYIGYCLIFHMSVEYHLIKSILFNYLAVKYVSSYYSKTLFMLKKFLHIIEVLFNYLNEHMQFVFVIFIW